MDLYIVSEDYILKTIMAKMVQKQLIQLFIIHLENIGHLKKEMQMQQIRKIEKI